VHDDDDLQFLGGVSYFRSLPVEELIQIRACCHVFDADDGVVAHVNDEVDVLLVGVTGAGVVAVDGTDHPVGAGQALVIPKGARGAIRAVGGRFAYLSCHRRRAGLWPAGVPRPGERASGGPERGP